MTTPEHIALTPEQIAIIIDALENHYEPPMKAEEETAALLLEELKSGGAFVAAKVGKMSSEVSEFLTMLELFGPCTFQGRTITYETLSALSLGNGKPDVSEGVRAYVQWADNVRQEARALLSDVDDALKLRKRSLLTASRKVLDAQCDKLAAALNAPEPSIDWPALRGATTTDELVGKKIDFTKGMHELPADDPFVIAMTQPISERTQAELKAIDDNIRAAQAAASTTFIGSVAPEAQGIGKWLSAALDDPSVCEEMKSDIRAWFDAGEPSPTKPEVSLRDAADTSRHPEALEYLDDDSTDPYVPWGDAVSAISKALYERDAARAKPEVSGSGEPMPYNWQESEARIKRLMEQCGMPNSMSVFNAMKQLEYEVRLSLSSPTKPEAGTSELI